MYFPVNFAKFLRAIFYITPPDDCFWLLCSYMHNLEKAAIIVEFDSPFKKNTLMANVNKLTVCFIWVQNFKCKMKTNVDKKYYKNKKSK